MSGDVAICVPISLEVSEPSGASAAFSAARPLAEDPALSARTAEWMECVRPSCALERWMVELMAKTSVHLDLIDRQRGVLRNRDARRASLDWDEKRGLDVEELGAKLSRNPAKILRQLRAGRHGCAWLIGRWEGLVRVLRDRGGWDDSQRSLAHDLLGTPPDLRDGDLATAGPGELEAIARREVADLERRRDGHLGALDDLDRSAAESGLAIDDSPEARLLRRDESACLRRLTWAWGMIQQSRKDSATASPPTAAAASPPSSAEPEPEPEPEPAMPPILNALVAAVAARSAEVRQRHAPASPDRRPTPEPHPLNRRARRALLKQHARRA